MEETRQLARFASRTQYEDLPPDLVAQAKIYILDNLAAGLVGSRQPWAQIVIGLVRDLGGRGEASAFCQAWQTDVSRAALLNGTMIGAFEIEHIGHSAHASGTAFPPALAVAERDHRDGRALITATLVGYEVVCRIGAAQTGAVERDRGFHNPGANGPFGAAAAVGSLLGLDETRMAWALGIAGSSGGGLTEFVWEGAMTKRIHLGRAAQLGLESALLAARGFTGPTTVLEGPYGYFHAFSPRPAVEKLLPGLGHEWLSRRLTVKAYPSHATTQAIVHAVRVYKDTHPVDLSTLTRVSVTSGGRVVEPRHFDRAPTSILGAQYSVPYALAVALVRDMSNPLVFGVDVLEDPAIRGLAAKIEAHEDNERFGDDHHGYVSEITLEFGDRSVRLLADGFPGALAQPLDFAGITEKFTRFATPVIGRAPAAAIVERVADLERLGDAADLAALLRAPHVPIGHRGDRG